MLEFFLLGAVILVTVLLNNQITKDIPNNESTNKLKWYGKNEIVIVFILLVAMHLITTISCLRNNNEANLIIMVLVSLALSILFIAMWVKNIYLTIDNKSSNQIALLVRMRKISNIITGFAAMLFLFAFGSILFNTSGYNQIGDCEVGVLCNNEFSINVDSEIYVDDDYIYIISDFYNGMNIYDKTGIYLGTFYVEPAKNGAIKYTVFDGRIFIEPNIGFYTYGFTGLDYYGKIYEEAEEPYEKETLKVYDSNDQIVIDEFEINYSSEILGFDYEFIYYYDYLTEEAYKANETSSEIWNENRVGFESQFEEDGNVYSFSGSSIVKDGAIVIQSSNSDYVISNLPSNIIIAIISAISFAVGITIPDRISKQNSTPYYK